MDNCSCKCAGNLTLVFACGGAADVGEISDRVARKLNRDGVGKMFCIVGIEGGSPALWNRPRLPT